MKKSTGKMIKTTALVGAAVAGIATASAYVSTKFLINTALDRDMPKIMRHASGRISGEKKNEDYVKAVRAAASLLPTLEHEDVKITSHDGETLVGHYFHVSDARRLIIAFHGWRSSWSKDFGLISQFWNQNQCDVLYVEQRGQNNSTGEYMGFGLIEKYDCLSWVKWATDNITEKLPIYLAGVSMGSATVLMASGLDLPDNVHGIMADCGFTSPKAIWKHVIRRNLHLPYGIRGIVADRLCRRKISVGSEDCSTVTALEHARVPVLFVHGSSDKFVPVEMTYRNYAACASPKELLIIPGADHAMSYYVDTPKYETEMKKFWDKYDI